MENKKRPNDDYIEPTQSDARVNTTVTQPPLTTRMSVPAQSLDQEHHQQPSTDSPPIKEAVSEAAPMPHPPLSAGEANKRLKLTLQNEKSGADYSPSVDLADPAQETKGLAEWVDRMDVDAKENVNVAQQSGTGLGLEPSTGVESAAQMVAGNPQNLNVDPSRITGHQSSTVQSSQTQDLVHALLTAGEDNAPAPVAFNDSILAVGSLNEHLLTSPETSAASQAKPTEPASSLQGEAANLAVNPQMTSGSIEHQAQEAQVSLEPASDNPADTDPLEGSDASASPHLEPTFKTPVIIPPIDSTTSEASHDKIQDIADSSPTAAPVTSAADQRMTLAPVNEPEPSINQSGAEAMTLGRDDGDDVIMSLPRNTDSGAFIKELSGTSPSETLGPTQGLATATLPAHAVQVRLEGKGDNQPNPQPGPRMQLPPQPEPHTPERQVSRDVASKPDKNRSSDLGTLGANMPNRPQSGAQASPSPAALAQTTQALRTTMSLSALINNDDDTELDQGRNGRVPKPQRQPYESTSRASASPSLPSATSLSRVLASTPPPLVPTPAPAAAGVSSMGLFSSVQPLTSKAGPPPHVHLPPTPHVARPQSTPSPQDQQRPPHQHHQHQHGSAPPNPSPRHPSMDHTTSPSPSAPTSIPPRPPSNHSGMARYREHPDQAQNDPHHPLPSGYQAELTLSGSRSHEAPTPVRGHLAKDFPADEVMESGGVSGYATQRHRLASPVGIRPLQDPLSGPMNGPSNGKLPGLGSITGLPPVHLGEPHGHQSHLQRQEGTHVSMNHHGTPYSSNQMSTLSNPASSLNGHVPLSSVVHGSHISSMMHGVQGHMTPSTPIAHSTAHRPRLVVKNDSSLKMEGRPEEFLGYHRYNPAKLLPPVQGRENCLLEVRVASSYLTFDNVKVKRRELWGTDIYTDDSDVVAMIIHAGYYIPPISSLGRDQDPLRPIGLQHNFVEPPLQHICPSFDLAVTLRVMPSLIRYQGSIRHRIKSRTWKTKHDGASLRIESVRKLSAGEALNRGRSQSKRRMKENNAERQRVLANVHDETTESLQNERAMRTATFEFTHQGDPCFKYSPELVMDRHNGLSRKWTSWRLKKEVLILENDEERYEISLQHQAGTDSRRFDLYRFAVISPRTSLSSWSKAGYPLDSADLAEVLYEDLDWQDFEWVERGVVVQPSAQSKHAKARKNTPGTGSDTSMEGVESTGGSDPSPQGRLRALRDMESGKIQEGTMDDPGALQKLGEHGSVQVEAGGGLNDFIQPSSLHQDGVFCVVSRLFWRPMSGPRMTKPSPAPTSGAHRPSNADNPIKEATPVVSEGDVQHSQGPLPVNALTAATTASAPEIHPVVGGGDTTGSCYPHEQLHVGMKSASPSPPIGAASAPVPKQAEALGSDPKSKGLEVNASMVTTEAARAVLDTPQPLFGLTGSVPVVEANVASSSVLPSISTALTASALPVPLNLTSDALAGTATSTKVDELDQTDSSQGSKDALPKLAEAVTHEDQGPAWDQEQVPSKPISATDLSPTIPISGELDMKPRDLVMSLTMAEPVEDQARAEEKEEGELEEGEIESD